MDKQHICLIINYICLILIKIYMNLRVEVS